MVDRYSSFAALADSEREGVDYRIVLQRTAAVHCVVAPHGGGIEPGTSELASAIAARDHSLYAFEGLKRADNLDLHVTSTRFDEPQCLALIASSVTLPLTEHGPGRVRALPADQARHLDCDDLFLLGLGERGFPDLAGRRVRWRPPSDGSSGTTRNPVAAMVSRSLW